MSITCAGGLALEDGPDGLCERAEGGVSHWPFLRGCVHVDLYGGLYGLCIGAECAVPRRPYALEGGRRVLDVLRKDQRVDPATKGCNAGELGA